LAFRRHDDKGVVEMRYRRRKGTRRWLGWLEELPAWQRAVLVAAPVGVAALAYAGRRRLWQGIGLVASAVEEVADTVEDAAEDLRDTARERAAT
jgi:hypothetical protein